MSRVSQRRSPVAAWLMIAVALVAGLMWLGTRAPDAPYVASVVENAVVDALRRQNPTVVGGVWWSPTALHVGVVSARRELGAYADSVCGVVQRYGLRGRHVRVHVVDAAQLAHQGELVELGTASCL